MGHSRFISVKTIFCICGGIGLLAALSAPASALPPDPNNAALLYYQAFLICPEPPDRKVPRAPGFEPHPLELQLLDEAARRRRLRPFKIESALDAVERGDEPDELVREYLRTCRETIELAEKAAQLSECDWGILYSGGIPYCSFHLLPTQSLARVLYADARVLAADGDCRAAIACCLSASRLAWHLGDDTYGSYATSIDIDRCVLRCVRQILASMSLDVEMIMWLKNRLAPILAPPRSPSAALQIDFEYVFQGIRSHENILAHIRRSLRQSADRKQAQTVHELTDDELVDHIREVCSEFLDVAPRVMGSGLPYEKGSAEIQELTNRLEEKVRSDPIANPVVQDIMAYAGNWRRAYTARTRMAARVNALHVALEIYLMIAQTGRLPEVLPDGVPKDPFSGEAFDYERTKDGFALRCRTKPVGSGEVQRVEFPVSQQEAGK